MIGLSSRNRAIAVGRVRVDGVRLGREDEAVRYDERVVARVLAGLREGREVGRVAEGLGVTESHGLILPDIGQRPGTDQCTRSVLRAIPNSACPAPLNVVSSGESP